MYILPTRFAENIYARVDRKKHLHCRLEEVVDNWVDKGAMIKRDVFHICPNGVKIPKEDHSGWSFLVKWKGGEYEWTKLKDLKMSNPVNLAQYVMTNAIVDEPAFC